MKPKTLASKQANLMRATKSSAIRNNLVGQIASKYQSQSNSLMDTFGAPSLSKKSGHLAKSKGRNGKASPNRNNSPLNKSKSLASINQRGVINLREAEQDFTETGKEGVNFDEDINNINFYTV